jgi:hypothetical protein
MNLFLALLADVSFFLPRSILGPKSLHYQTIPRTSIKINRIRAAIMSSDYQWIFICERQRNKGQAACYYSLNGMFWSIRNVDAGVMRDVCNGISAGRESSWVHPSTGFKFTAKCSERQFLAPDSARSSKLERDTSHRFP